MLSFFWLTLFVNNNRYCQSFAPNGMGELKLVGDRNDSDFVDEYQEEEDEDDDDLDESMLSKEEFKRLKKEKQAAKKARKDKHKKEVALRSKMANKRIKDFDKIKKLRR